MSKAKKMKIALFGDCIPLGTLSEWIETDGKKVPHVYRPKGNNIFEKLSEKYEVDNYAQGHNGICYTGCAKPQWAKCVDTKISTVYKILNNDLSKYNVVLIFLGGNDFYRATYGPNRSKIPHTLYGALNLITEKLNAYDGKVIWVMPPFRYRKDRKFETYLKLLKQYTADYISFYDEYKDMINNDVDNLFPDRSHPSVECREIMVPYVTNKIIELIENG